VKKFKIGDLVKLRNVIHNPTIYIVECSIGQWVKLRCINGCGSFSADYYMLESASDIEVLVYMTEGTYNE